MQMVGESECERQMDLTSCRVYFSQVSKSITLTTAEERHFGSVA